MNRAVDVQQQRAAIGGGGQRQQREQGGAGDRGRLRRPEAPGQSNRGDSVRVRFISKK